VFGTRFLLTPEAEYTPAQKAALLAAHATDTVRSVAFDESRGTTGWPAGVDGRGLRNALVADFEAGVGVEEIKRRFEENAKKGGDPGYAIVWSGTGISEMNEIKPAKVRVICCVKGAGVADGRMLQEVMKLLGEEMFQALQQAKEIVGEA
jgi:nitronate monooxygenase